jgi:hypothetical protein
MTPVPIETAPQRLNESLFFECSWLSTYLAPFGLSDMGKRHIPLGEDVDGFFASLSLIIFACIQVAIQILTQ